MVVEMALSRGSFTFRATSARCLEAFRAFDFAFWENPRDLLNWSRASSLLRTAMESATAAISSVRVLVLAAYSLSKAAP